MVELGGAGLGIVAGWLLPIVRSRTWPAVLASAAAFTIVVGALSVLAGLTAGLGAAVGMGAGTWLHAAFLEHLARMARAREG